MDSRAQSTDPFPPASSLGPASTASSTPSPATNPPPTNPAHQADAAAGTVRPTQGESPEATTASGGPNGPPQAIQGQPAPAAGVAGPPPSPLSPVFWANLLLCFGLGVGVAGWLLYFTDWYEEVGGLLALTGLFGWLGFVFNVMPKERAERIRDRVWVRLFDNPRFLLYELAFLVLAVGAACCLGSIQLEGVQLGADGLVWISRAGGASDADLEPERMPANGRLRRVVWASWLAGEYRVRVSGLPEQTFRVGPAIYPGGRTDRQVPFSFLRPVVLIWPEKSLVKQMLREKPYLVLVINGSAYLTVFDGSSVWVGYKGAMIVPKHVQDAQSYQSEPALLSLLLQPKALSDSLAAVPAGQPFTGITKFGDAPPEQLKPGDTVQALLFRQGQNKAYAQTALYKVRPVEVLPDMVQPLPLQIDGNP